MVPAETPRGPPRHAAGDGPRVRHGAALRPSAARVEMIAGDRLRIRQRLPHRCLCRSGGGGFRGHRHRDKRGPDAAEYLIACAQVLFLRPGGLPDRGRPFTRRPKLTRPGSAISTGPRGADLRYIRQVAWNRWQDAAGRWLGTVSGWLDDTSPYRAATGPPAVGLAAGLAVGLPLAAGLVAAVSLVHEALMARSPPACGDGEDPACRRQRAPAGTGHQGAPRGLPRADLVPAYPAPTCNAGRGTGRSVRPRTACCAEPAGRPADATRRLFGSARSGRDPPASRLQAAAGALARPGTRDDLPASGPAARRRRPLDGIIKTMQGPASRSATRTRHEDPDA